MRDVLPRDVRSWQRRAGECAGGRAALAPAERFCSPLVYELRAGASLAPRAEAHRAVAECVGCERRHSTPSYVGPAPYARQHQRQLAATRRAAETARPGLPGKLG